MAGRSLPNPSRVGNAAAGRPQPAIGIVIPTLDEAGCIDAAVQRARALDGAPEVVVADGGSHDATVALARAAGARVLEAPRGRGPQLNAGARATRAAILLFLHADCTLPADAVEQVRCTLARGHGAGRFRVRYASSHALMRISGALTRWDTPFTSFGEGAVFVHREFFERVGGFPDWPLFEDVELLRRLRRVTRIGRAPGRVQASARRFHARGVWRQQLANAALLTAFHLGVSPQRLQRLYGPVRDP